METAGRAGCHLACPIELPVSTATVPFVVISHLSLVLAPAAKLRTNAYGIVSVFVTGHPPGQTPLLRGALVCSHAPTGMDKDPVTRPECCASAIRSKVPTSIQTHYHECGVNAQQDSGRLTGSAATQSSFIYKNEWCEVALVRQRLPAPRPSANLASTGSVACAQLCSILVACQLC